MLDNGKKYCKHCGEIIDSDCVICPKCGKQVEKIGSDGNTPIIVNNSASSSASAAASAATGNGKVRKKYNLLLDLILIFCTCGGWIIWMLIRPKYEY